MKPGSQAKAAFASFPDWRGHFFWVGRVISSPLAHTVPLRGEAQKEGSHRVRTAQGFKTRNQCLLFKGNLNFPKIRYSFYFPYGSLPVCVCGMSVAGAHRGQRRTSGPWNWGYGWLWTTMLSTETEPGFSWQQSVLLTTKSSLQSQESSFDPIFLRWNFKSLKKKSNH